MDSRLVFLSFAAFLAFSNVTANEEIEKVLTFENEKVLTLDYSNFSEIVSKHDFIVVEFYAPWCGHCKALAPEYEKAAVALSVHDPPIVLAKVDANEEANRELASEFKLQGFPTIKILRNGGKNSQDYKGPREADGIVDYLKKQVGPASAEIKSDEDASSLIDEKSVFIFGLFPKFSGEEYENFMSLADKLRSDYSFGHTLSESVDKPTLRVLKPFDEPIVNSQDFRVDAMEKFIEETTVPILTVWNNDPSNHAYLEKFFNSPNAKAMLFVNFSTEQDSFQTKYKEVATSYKGKGVGFLMGDIDAAQNAFEYFGLTKEKAPVLIIQKAEGQKYLKETIEPQHIATWMKDYMDGKIKPFVKSEPVPEINNEPVKVVVRDSLQDVVFNSGMDVLLEFYAPWCGHCKELAPILDEVAISFENDPSVMIAKFDATANDVPSETFEVQGFPTLYFKSATGNLSQYEGGRTKEDIIEFIQNNRYKPSQSTSIKSEAVRSESVDADSAKDEL